MKPASMCYFPSPHVLHMLLLLTAVLVAVSESGNDVCVSGEGSSCSANVVHRKAKDMRSADAGRPQQQKHRKQRDSAGQRHSLLDQEVLELGKLSELYQQRLRLLEDLRRNLGQTGMPGLPRPSAQALLEAVPPIAEQVITGAPPGPARSEIIEDDEEAEELPSAGNLASASAVGDFIVSKAVVPQEQRVSFIGFLPLRNHRSAAPTPLSQVAMPTVLVVAAQSDGEIRFFTVSGDLAMTYSTGHKKPLIQLAVSPMQDEYMIAAIDETGMMRVHRFLVRPRRNPMEQKRRVTNPDEEKISQYLSSPANITVQFQMGMKLPYLSDSNISSGSERPHVSTFILTSYQGVKYFVMGDTSGWISIITRNGTLHGRTRVSNSTVQRVSSHLGNIIFVSEGHWGFVDVDKGTARKYVCKKYEGPPIIDAITDSSMQSRVLAVDQEGTVWVFLMREKQDCKIEHRFPRSVVRPPVMLSSIRGYVLTLENMRRFGGRSEIMALNMSHVGKGWDDPARDVSPITFRKSGLPVAAWAVQKRYQEGDLVATLSQDGMEIEISELLMQAYQPPPGDTLGNFKLPVFAAAMVLVMGYQFVKQKGPFDPGNLEAGGN